MAGFSSIIEGCRNIYCDSPVSYDGAGFPSERFSGIMECPILLNPCQEHISASFLLLGAVKKK